MIFVTVGTIHFDPLIHRVDETVGRGIVRDEVILQIGFGGSYVPRHCRYIRSAPTLESFERSADLVVGHGGTGTTLEVLNMGKPLISVPNPALSDDHQREFLEALEAAGLVTYCRDIDDLPTLMVSRPTARPRLAPRSRLAAELDARIRELTARQGRPRGGLIGRIAERVAGRVEIDVAGVLRSDAGSPWTSMLIDPRGRGPHQQPQRSGCGA